MRKQTRDIVTTMRAAHGKTRYFLFAEVMSIVYRLYLDLSGDVFYSFSHLDRSGDVSRQGFELSVPNPSRRRATTFPRPSPRRASESERDVSFSRAPPRTPHHRAGGARVGGDPRRF